MRASSTSSGRAPESSTWSWKARMSNFVAQRLLGAVAQLQNLQLADLVGQRLAGPRDVAVHLGLDAGFVDGGVVVEVLDHLLAGPVLGVDAGVDHQADGAPDVGLQAAVVGVGVLVKADVLAQPLGVEPPALDKGRVFSIFAEGRARRSAPARWRSAGDGRECLRGRRWPQPRKGCGRWRCRCRSNSRPGRLPSGVPAS